MATALLRQKVLKGWEEKCASISPSLSSTSTIDSDEYEARATQHKAAMYNQVLDFFKEYETEIFMNNENSKKKYDGIDENQYECTSEEATTKHSSEEVDSIPSWHSQSEAQCTPSCSSMHDWIMKRQTGEKMVEVNEKSESVDIFKTFLDRHRKKCEKVDSSEKATPEASQETLSPYCDPRRVYNPKVYPEPLKNNLLEYVFENPSEYVIRLNRFPTKEGQVWYENFNRNHRKYTAQYSCKMYRQFRERSKTAKVEGNHMEVTDDWQFDFFSIGNVNLLEPYTKLKALTLLCNRLQESNPKIINLEEARLSCTHGVALILAINVENVEKLFMYNSFDNNFHMYDTYSDANVKYAFEENALNVLREYEFYFFNQKNKKDYERKKACHKNYDTHVMLSTAIQVINGKVNKRSNNDVQNDHFANKCYLLEKPEFKFDMNHMALYPALKNAIRKEGSSLKFLRCTQGVTSLRDGEKVESILYKYCMTHFSNLKILSCNYQYVADASGDILKHLSSHCTLQCLQLFLGPILSKPQDNLPFNVIPNDTWILCKNNCPWLKVHFVITGLLFNVAEKFLTKAIPLCSLHVSSGALIPQIKNRNDLVPLLRIVMNNYETSLKALSISLLWKSNFSESLDMVLPKLVKHLKTLRILEFTGDVNDLTDVINKMSKAKGLTLKKIIFKVNNVSRHEINQVYTQYGPIFKSDNVQFTLVPLNIYS